MEDSDITVLAEYQKYKSENPVLITEDQNAYVLSLCNGIQDPIVKKEYLQKYQNLNSEAARAASETSLYLFIEELKTKSAISTFQFMKLAQQFTEEEIKTLLKKNLTDLTQKDAELLQNPEKFKSWVREHPLKSDHEWEYGWQESNKCKDFKMYYLKFYNMMMIDVDHEQILESKTDNCGSFLISSGIKKDSFQGSFCSEEQKEQIRNKLKTLKNFRFRVYKTFNGFHIFITSMLIQYNNNLVNQIAKEIGGDLFYTLFANKYGFKVRLSPKLGRQETYIAKYLFDVNEQIPEDPICKDLIKIHDEYTTRPF